jgi:hypothetical protein
VTVEFVAVEFSGELTLKTIAGAHERLGEALAGGAPVTAAVDADAVVDLSFVQLLLAARRTAREAGGEFALARPAAGGLLETLTRGGFVETADQRAFWLGETGEQ